MLLEASAEKNGAHELRPNGKGMATMNEDQFQGLKAARWGIANAIKKKPTLTAKEAMALLDTKIMQHLKQRDKT